MPHYHRFKFAAHHKATDT